MTHRFRITHPARLIDALKEHLDAGFSARFIKRALEANVCRVNGRVERFASKTLKVGDIVELQANWDQIDQPQTIAVLYEDDDLFIIDKPANAVCTDDYFSKRLKKRLFLAHRLDKDTTGVLLLGKSKKAAEELQECFEKRDVHKEYLAIVDKPVTQKEGVIKSFFAKKRAFDGQTIWGSSKTGLYAETKWTLVASSKTASLILCEPLTGRTHQIRVHMAEMGHPIILDRQYSDHFQSNVFVSRPMLHAKKIKFLWRGKKLSISSPLPSDFLETLKQLEISYDE